MQTKGTFPQLSGNTDYRVSGKGKPMATKKPAVKMPKSTKYGGGKKAC